MRKNTFLLAGIILSCAFLNNALKAQITIQQADMPQVNSKAVMIVDNSGSFSPGLKGGPITWNFSTLGGSQSNQYLFANPPSTPYFAYFHAADLADSMVYANGYTYFSSTASHFSAVGQGLTEMGLKVGLTLHPAFTQITLPASYAIGNIDGGMSRGDTAIKYAYLTFDSVGARINIHYADTVDAYGTITTPFGTQNVLRQKHWDITVDSLRGHTPFVGWSNIQVTTTKDYIYRWYANGMPYFFATMQMNYTNTHDSLVQWFDGTDVGIAPISHSAFTSVYPNPCKTEITFSCSSTDARQISIFDITGRQIANQEIRNGNLIMNTSAYSAGMYFYHVSDISGSVIDRGKFIVQ
jgi:hypothetical protein